ncbi:hypothetical protein QBC44DRAFT_321876 [Cladorrhinum sp. PSN332]|nr:hypothetical protein QBC44DRAFT_321876 [Cladorrhinum sp. PSN332]
MNAKISHQAWRSGVSQQRPHHEIARSFDRLLSLQPLQSPGVAQALLSHASGVSLSELRRCLHDPQLGSRKTTRKHTPAPIVPQLTWLSFVTN